MKKLIIVLVILFTLLSCTPEDNTNCNCGIIQNYRYNTNKGVTELTVKNNCSGKEEIIILPGKNNFENSYGNKFCIN